MCVCACMCFGFPWHAGRCDHCAACPWLARSRCWFLMGSGRCKLVWDREHGQHPTASASEHQHVLASCQLGKQQVM